MAAVAGEAGEEDPLHVGVLREELRHGGSVLLLALYGVGHCAVIVAAGTFTEVVQRYLNWNERSRGGVILRGVCGVLVLIGGVYLIYTAP